MYFLRDLQQGQKGFYPSNLPALADTYTQLTYITDCNCQVLSKTLGHAGQQHV